MPPRAANSSVIFKEGLIVARSEMLAGEQITCKFNAQVRALVRTVDQNSPWKTCLRRGQFLPVFRDRKGRLLCISAHRSRLLGRFWGAWSGGNNPVPGGSPGGVLRPGELLRFDR